jgi:hypothetical protein
MRSRTDQAKQVVFEVTGQVARLAEAQLADTRRVLAGARRALARGRARPAGRLRAVVEELQTAIGRTQRVLDQANTRLAGGMPDGPAGWSACTTRTPARSARAASAGRSSSATRPRSSTTPTGSSWTTPSWSATHPMRRCWPRHQTGHRPHRQGARSGDHRPGRRRGPHRPGADRARVGRVAIPRRAAQVPPAEWLRASAAPAGWSSGAPAARPDQLPQAPLRLGPHPDGRPPRRPHLVRPRRVRPQPGQDRRAAGGQAQHHSTSTQSASSSDHDHPSQRLIAHHQTFFRGK